MIEEVFEDPDLWVGRDGIRRLGEHYRSIANFPGRQHHASNVLVTPVADDRVQVRSFSLVTECQGEPPHKLRFCGYCDDVIVRLEGEWRFARRVVRGWDGEVLNRFPGRANAVSRGHSPEFKRIK